MPNLRKVLEDAIQEVRDTLEYHKSLPQHDHADPALDRVEAAMIAAKVALFDLFCPHCRVEIADEDAERRQELARHSPDLSPLIDALTKVKDSCQKEE